MSKITTNEMTQVPIERLIPYINNARTHSPEQIKKLRASLREFGFVNPILIDRDYNVIAGHGRLAAAREEGFTEVPCVYVDHLTEAQKKAYILADNRMAMDAGWDEELLKVELESLQEMAYDRLPDPAVYTDQRRRAGWVPWLCQHAHRLRSAWQNLLWCGDRAEVCGCGSCEIPVCARRK